MFKDDYKSANEKIVASNELKKRTLEKIHTKREPNTAVFVRYGLVCASFLFVVAMFPVLQKSGGLTSNHPDAQMINDTTGERMPQTGVDESTVYQEDAVLEQYYRTTKELQLAKMALDDLHKEQQQSDSSTAPTTPKPESKPQSQLQAESPPLKPQAQSKPQSEPPAQTETQAPACEYESDSFTDETYLTQSKKIEDKLESMIQEVASLIPPDSIIVNELTSVSVKAPRMKLPTYSEKDGYRTEQWSQKQVNEYLKTSPIPTYIPTDLGDGYLQVENRTQKVVFDKDNTMVNNMFQYDFLQPQVTKEFNPLRRALTVTVTKDKVPTDATAYRFKENPTPSLLKGREIKLGLLKQAYAFDEKNQPIKFYDMYIAEFVHLDVGYRVVASNLTQQEFTDVVASIIVPIQKKETPNNPASNTSSTSNTSSVTGSSSTSSAPVTSSGTVAASSTSPTSSTPESTPQSSSPKK